MPAQAQLTLFSPAKINLYLRIVGKRPDGYHDLETVMLPLDFGDTITLALRKTSITLESDNPLLPTDDTNLALRAAKALATRCGVEAGAKITLRKRTPLAAGLGGGSSNAAAVLGGLNRLWNAGATEQIMHELAASIGSDINFFLTGSGAVCRGRGERVEPIPCKLSATILLVNPGFGISTKWAYDKWADASLTAPPPEVSLLLRALAEDDLKSTSSCLFNSLEVPSVRRFPVLELLKQAMRDEAAEGASMSGSGPTVFGLFAEDAAAQRAGQRIRERFGPSVWTQVTHFGRTSHS